MILFIFLFQAEPLDLLLPPWLRLLVTLFSLGLAGFVLFRSKTAKYWKEERDAAVSKAERLTNEMHTLKEENAALAAKTDITTLRTEILHAVTNNQVEHTAIVKTLEDVNKSLIELTKALMRFQKEEKGQ